MLECTKAPHGLSLCQIQVHQTLQNRDIPCLWGNPGLDAWMLQACKPGSLKKGKMR